MVIHPSSLWVAPLTGDSIQGTYYPKRGRVQIYLNGERLLIEFVEYIDSSEPSATH